MRTRVPAAKPWQREWSLNIICTSGCQSTGGAHRPTLMEREGWEEMGKQWLGEDVGNCRIEKFFQISSVKILWAAYFLYGSQLLKYSTGTQDDREMPARYQVCLCLTPLSINVIQWHTSRTNKKDLWLQNNKKSKGHKRYLKFIQKSKVRFM